MNFRAFPNWRRQPSRVTDILLIHKQVDVLANSSKFGHDPVPQAGMALPQHSQYLGDRLAGGGDPHCILAVGEFLQQGGDTNLNRPERRR